LYPGKWFELTPQEWDDWLAMDTKLQRLRFQLRKGGLNRPGKEGLDHQRDRLEWDREQMLRRLRLSRQEPDEYYVDEHDRGHDLRHDVHHLTTHDPPHSDHHHDRGDQGFAGPVR
ncbi:MAG: hypothetical protein HY815_31600, partial [Candidatus Riflebacteria bacterium]|nr:hypothetical protein [Candidatus Riflebacteria bacterium]